MSGPTALTALAAAGAVTLLTFVALAGIADVFGGARHRQVMPWIRQVSDNPAFASVSPIRKPARICP